MVGVRVRIVYSFYADNNSTNSVLAIYGYRPLDRVLARIIFGSFILYVVSISTVLTMFGSRQTLSPYLLDGDRCCTGVVV